jgi:hypothetical protein
MTFQNATADLASHNAANDWFITNKRMELASAFVLIHMTGKNGQLGEGSQPTPLSVISQLANRINVQDGDTYWDIGCGTPRMAFAMSAASNGGMVLATDYSEYHKNETN